jgi:UDP-N-acetylglucosamine 2-epimerase
LIDQVQPRAVLVFNGMFYPEAAARWTARQRGLPVIAHEVGLRPYTGFFTTGDATAYPIHIPETFELDSSQDQRLDEYLQQRFQGNFSMAGIRFWPEMKSLSAEFLERAGKYKQIVPVFTNVIFDTSQGHANVVFDHMFAWLDAVLEVIRRHPETFFVIRAHPDEARPGKESLESVAQWVRRNQVDRLENVLFVDAKEYFSSYELIQRSKFVIVYNSTIGLEAALMGAPVLCGGKARFTQISTVFFPDTPEGYTRTAEEFLACDAVNVPAEFKRNARRFLYYQLFKSSLPFDDYLMEDGVWKGFVAFRPDLIQKIRLKDREPLATIRAGILHGQEFLLEDGSIRP